MTRFFKSWMSQTNSWVDLTCVNWLNEGQKNRKWCATTNVIWFINSNSNLRSIYAVYEHEDVFEFIIIFFPSKSSLWIYLIYYEPKIILKKLVKHCICAVKYDCNNNCLHNLCVIIARIYVQESRKTTQNADNESFQSTTTATTRNTRT